MHNLNEYNQEEFEQQFSDTELGQAVAKDFDLLVWDKHLVTELLYTTPRQILGTKIGSMASFYYINKLLENNPESIHDIGCGWNMFKKYIPNIIGISPDNPDNDNAWYGDEFDFFDFDFVSNHQEYYESAMAICSLHYVPLSSLRDRVLGFISIIKDGGRGFISLDADIMIKRESPENLIDTFGSEEPSAELLDQYIREQLTDLPATVLIFDIDTAEDKDELDGNIRIVFEK
jgi:hypothetical protein